MTDRTSRLAFATKTIHAGQSPDPSTGAVMPPIYATSTYVQSSPGVHQGYEYSRTQNPTRMAYERSVAALESGAHGFAFASGMAATSTLMDLLEHGDHIVAMDDLYGGSFRLFDKVRKQSSGFDFSFVDMTDLDALEAVITSKTRMIWVETPTNPMLKIVDLAAVIEIAKKHNVITVADNTFASPFNQRPLEYGFDIVMHSATKFLSGHGVVIGGLLVDGGRFDWTASDRFPTLTEPYAGFHDLVFAHDFGPDALLMRARREGMRDLGACMAPTTAWQILQGLETLPLRMRQHVANTREVVAFLQGHDQVQHVGYPELDGHPDQSLAAELMPRGVGAVFAFDLRGGREAGRLLIESLELFSHLANVGDAKSLVIHPASTTHHRMDAAALASAGIGEGMVRLSIGLEDATDLIADLSRALKRVARKFGG